MNISVNGLHEVEMSEGWSSGPYFDRIGNVWTAYFGETKNIGPNSPLLTRAAGEAKLKVRWRDDYAWALHPFEHLTGFTQNMYDALASFIWNCGVGAVSASTTVGRLLRAKQWGQAANAMLAWCKAQGKRIEALYTRRVRERKLFLTKVKVAVAAYLTPWERRTAADLTSERRTAKRHGGWDKVDDSHLERAVKLKADLRARVHTLEKSDLSKAHRRERLDALKAVIA